MANRAALEEQNAANEWIKLVECGCIAKAMKAAPPNENYARVMAGESLVFSWAELRFKFSEVKDVGSWKWMFLDHRWMAKDRRGKMGPWFFMDL